jgi:hypothetical protein
MNNSYVLMALMLLSNGPLNAQLNWQTFNVPGAASTWIDGIDGENIVGSFSLPNQVSTTGFLYNRRSEVWTYLTAPSYDWTLPLAISGNTIVGSAGSNTSSLRNGFSFQNSTGWSFLNSPVDGFALEALGIDGSNIVGGTASGRSFVYDGTTWSHFNSPFGDGSAAEGISGNTIVGTYHNESNYLYGGFIKNENNWTLLNVPGAFETLPRDVDGGGIVGQFRETTNSFGSTRSFLFNGGSMTYLDAPTAESTYAWGIDGETIVGSYNDSSGASHGFILTVPEPSALSLCAVGLGGLVMMRRRRS